MNMPCGRSSYCGRESCRRSAYCAQKEREAAGGGAAFAGSSCGDPANPQQYCAAESPLRREAPHASAPRPPKKALATPADVVYVYDGSRPGFFCCVHESVYAHELPAAIYPETDSQPTLFQQKWIETDPEKARRVEESISNKISPRARSLIDVIFLSCLVEKEMAMLRFLLLGYQEGRRVTSMLGHETVAPLLAAEKHLLGEAHLLRGFVRFSDYGGVLAATITPKNFVLPFLAGHFAARYSGEEFLIFDKTHKAALLYQNRQKKIVPLEHIDFPEASEEETGYRALWKQFYRTIAIEARENPRCRMTHMPKRYWENMTEMQEYL